MNEKVRLDFHGRTAVVTGGGRGIGRAIALDLARRGAAVVVNGRAPSQGGGGAIDSVVEEIRRLNGRAAAVYTSVETPEGGRAVIEAAVENFGSVDILVNNAGFMRNAAFTALTPADVNDVLGVHIRGIFNVTQPAIALMRERNYGRIVNLGSTTALIGVPGLANYAAAKGGVFALTRAIAAEGSPHGILANTLIPTASGKMQANSPLPGFRGAYGALWDKLSPRLNPETVTPLATYLASSACSHSGEAYAACAGRFARVSIQFARGWLALDANSAQAEHVAEHFDEIRNMSGSFEPRSLQDIYQDILARLPAC